MLQKIVEAFKTHLVANAARHKGAIVVFHYSGHGSHAPDANGDEGDGEDETLVPVDSRDEEGKNFDVLDDELNVLFAELTAHTQNVTFILDSRKRF